MSKSGDGLGCVTISIPFIAIGLFWLVVGFVAYHFIAKFW